MDGVVALSEDRNERGRAAVWRMVDANRIVGRLPDAGQALIKTDRRGMIGAAMMPR